LVFLTRPVYKVVEKRYERRLYKTKFSEKAEFISINEHFEANFNAVVASAIVFNRLLCVMFAPQNMHSGFIYFPEYE